jgi:uncharacterized repeat protein (TIGR01451 family)
MLLSHRPGRLRDSKRGYFLIVALALGLGLTVLWASGTLLAPASVSALSAEAQPPIPAPGLAPSSKSASQYVVHAGDLLTYTIQLRNVGMDAVLAQVTDPLPALVDYISGTATAGAVYDTDTRTLSWEAISVPMMSDVSLSFVVTATEVTTATIVSNTAVISAAGGSFERSAAVLVIPESAGPGPILGPSRKLASRHRIVPGDLLTYTIRLRNVGTEQALAQVTDPLPELVQYVSGSATPGAVYDADARTLSWEAISVPVRSDVSLSFAVTATQVTTPTVVSNTAVISTAGGSLERSAAVLVFPESVGPGPILAPSRKLASRHRIAPGDPLTYTIRLRNVGMDEAVAQVTDPLPGLVHYVSGSATPAAVYDEGSRTLSWDGISVPMRGEVSLSFAVTATQVATPTVVSNTAVISAAGRSFERQALVLLAPEAPGRYPRLAGSRKSASQHVLPPDDILTYTIRLHNSGTAEAVAQVTDRLPAEVTYVPDSATGSPTYDPDAETLSWEGIIVPVRGDVSLSFAVTATEVVTPTVVTNTAAITADGKALERQAHVLLVPERPPRDVVDPVVHSLTIDEEDVLSSPTVTLHISATDDVAVDRMFLREWRWAATPWPHWRVVQSSGWVPYQPDYPWTLSPDPGAHSVGVWVSDGARNRSQLDLRALDFASLVEPGAMLPPFGMVPYLVYYDAAVDVGAVVSSTTGSAELYAWYTGDLSEPLGAATDEISFTTEVSGTYLFVVEGEPGATFDLTIEPGGGPRHPTDGVPMPHIGRSVQAASAGTASGGTTYSRQAEDLIAVLAESGLDPMEVAEAPGEPFMVYLPIVTR